MERHKSTSAMVLFFLAVLFIASACLGGETTREVVVVTATSEPDDETTDEETGPAAEEPTVTPTLAPVTMTAGQALSCVKGPHWILYEWVAGIAEGETVTLLGRHLFEEDEYYFARKDDGTECWAFGGSSTIDGDPNGLPEMEAPPLPEIAFVIENKILAPICEVYIREKDETAWGADRTGAGDMPVGTSISVNLTAGFYDVLVKDCFGGELYYQEDRAIGSDSNYRYTAIATEVEFYVQNGLSENLCKISFKPTGTATWIDKHTAADGEIAPGEQAWITVVVGSYDYLVRKCPSLPVEYELDEYFGPGFAGFTVTP